MPSNDRNALADTARKLDVIRRARHAAESTDGIDPLERVASAESLPADAIEGYTLSCEARRGGQGVVYRAVQHATGRDVALKVLREGPFASSHDRARFEREVRVLASMRHPNIVTVHDSGSATGRAWLAMDFVDGRPLDEYVALTSRGPRHVAELIATIAEALETAHLRGIIHRDLKPSNILVDDDGVPHILDFGLAKTETDAGEQTMTASGQFVGSLPWASPEQVEPLLSIDLRTDVYALGVILFHSLTGTFPYDVDSSPRQTLEHIVSSEPVRPRALRPEIHDDLETIVLTCLRKDPARRYQSAGALARDLRSWLDGDVIDAKRDSTWYIVKTVLRRHRPAVALIGLALVALVAFTIMLAIALDRAVSAEAIASERAERNQRVLAGLERLFRTMDPAHMGRTDVTIRELLDAGAEQVIGELDDFPEDQVRTMNVVADAYEGHGDWDAGFEWRTRVLELERHDLDRGPKNLCQVIDTVALAAARSGQYGDAETLYREAFDMSLEAWGEDHAATSSIRTGLAIVLEQTGRYDEAQVLFERSLELNRARLGDAKVVAINLVNLGALLNFRGEYAKSETLIREGLEMHERLEGPDSIDVGHAMRLLGSPIRRQGRLDEAERIYRHALDILVLRLGHGHQEVAAAKHSLGTLLKDSGRYDEAETMLREVLATREHALGHENPETISTVNNLGVLLGITGDYDEAESLLRRALAARRSSNGRASQHVATTAHNLGRLLSRHGGAEQAGEAESLLRDALEIRRGLGDHPDLGDTLRELAGHVRRRQRTEDVEPLLVEALDLQRRLLGEHDTDVAESLNELGLFRAQQRDFTGAAEAMRQASDIYVAALGPDHLSVGVTLSNLANILADGGEVDGVREIFEDALRIKAIHFDATDARLARQASLLGRFLVLNDEIDDAEPHLRGALEIQMQRLGPEHRHTKTTRDMLNRIEDARNANGGRVIGREASSPSTP